MTTLASGACCLPTHHITIRVPWYGGGWSDLVCARPLENTSCLILPRAYTEGLFKSKSAALFEHVYEAFAGEGRSVFSAVN